MGEAGLVRFRRAYETAEPGREFGFVDFARGERAHDADDVCVFGG